MTLALTSRARLRPIEPGCTATCPFCDLPVKFKAKTKQQQAVCNVYIKKVWNRVEQYHYDCYVAAGEPYGEAVR